MDVTSNRALSVKELSAGYGAVNVLQDVDLHVDVGETLALLGRNGMGKTTLLKAVVRLLPLNSGRIEIRGDDVTRERSYRIARRSVAYIAQEKALFQDLTVDENLRLGSHSPNYGEQLPVISALFPFIASRLRQRAGSLSGGEQKMLLVARALISAPALLLVDEISEGLQPTVRHAIIEALKRERQARGMAILLVEQNMGFAFALASRFLVLKRGRIVASGVPTDAAARETVATLLSV